MLSLSLVMGECFLSGRGQGHMSNFYTVDLENFATASRPYTGDIHNSTVVGLFMTHCLQLNFQLHTIGLVRTCRISSFCTVAWKLARLLLTRPIARSLGDSWASCTFLVLAHLGSPGKGPLNGCVCVYVLILGISEYCLLKCITVVWCETTLLWLSLVSQTILWSQTVV